jgi:phage shock protein PspC (stress-responsive transcriptional regulator)
MSHKKMTKTDDTDSWAGGVIGGICKHYEFDPFLFRIAYLGLLIATSGAFLLAYAALYFLMPDECEAKKD